MKRLLSTAYSDTLFNLGTFMLRLVVGILMCMNHGIPKIVNFGEWQNTFFDPFQFGHRWSLLLSIFAEALAPVFLVLGFLSRIAALLLVIDLGVAIFLFNKYNPISRFEDAILFFVSSLFIVMVGPGKISVDALTGK